MTAVVIVPEDKLVTVLSILNMDEKYYQKVTDFVEETRSEEKTMSRREKFRLGLLNHMYPEREEFLLLLRNSLRDLSPAIYLTNEQSYQKGYRCPHRHGIYGQKIMPLQIKKQKTVVHHRIYRVQNR